MVVGGESKCLWVGSAQPGPLDSMVKPPKRHGEAREVPDDGPEGVQPVAPHHHLIALQESFIMPGAALGQVWMGAPGMAGGAWRWGSGGVVAGAECPKERWDDGASGAIATVLHHM
jgi:hypothetical protein